MFDLLFRLFSYPDSWFDDLITNPALLSYVAISSDRIVGVLVAKIVSLEDCSPGDRKILDTCFPLHSNVAYILSLGVTETYRSQGIESPLTAKVMQLMRDALLLYTCVLRYTNKKLTSSLGVVFFLIQATHLLSAFISYASGAYYTQKHGHHKSVLPPTPGSYPYDTVSITDSSYATAVAPLIMFSPADRPANHNRTFRSLLDLLELFPPYPPVCYAIYLHVLRTNHTARQFYEHRGFHMVRVQRGCYTIAGMPADGCTYVLHVNGGFTDELTSETAVATIVAEPFRLYPSSYLTSVSLPPPSATCRSFLSRAYLMAKHQFDRCFRALRTIMVIPQAPWTKSQDYYSLDATFNRHHFH
ncbi:uncharacterized protein DEA37_0002700 [Paragonimus westermani]|uniref:N-alpha-acetyltransferase 60 n=1 Tax=Paragonimus westermani TaxID=34504 RepID=A0A5J4NLW7_9TREM|nr:uncharacterized protein DEA37_0002700 [Paragonimus westermani]